MSRARLAPLPLALALALVGMPPRLAWTVAAARSFGFRASCREAAGLLLAATALGPGRRR